MSPPADLDHLSPAELKDLVLTLLAEVAELRRTVAAQRDEIARLKGGPPRPDIKPSGMEQASDPKRPENSPKRPRGSTRSKLSIDEEREMALAAPPRGSRFKGYTSFVVQDLVIRAHVVNFRRERWQAPDGGVVTAPLSAGIDGHFGPQLRRFVLAQYHEAQTTVPRLVKLLCSLGIFISKRQVVRLLIEDHDSFVTEARDVLRAGLMSAPWITVDDTGARHKASNGFCTQIGNAHIAWFGTTGLKSRLNFLELLRAGFADYIVNAEALAYMRERALAAHVITRLVEHPDRCFADQKAWNAHLDALAITALKVSPDPVLIATEGALWGSVKAHGLLPNTVIVSDDAGQFKIGSHGLCWVHAERLVHKLDIYADPRRKAALRKRFDRIFKRKTGFVTLDRLLGRLCASKSELLMVLDRAEIPLHTNGSENDIRCHVTRRKLSGGTRSDLGRDCRDAFLGLAKTCAKLKISFWDYLGDRLIVPGAQTIPHLPEIILARAQLP